MLGPLAAALERAPDEHGTSLGAKLAEHRERVRSTIRLPALPKSLRAVVLSR